MIEILILLCIIIAIPVLIIKYLIRVVKYLFFLKNKEKLNEGKINLITRTKKIQNGNTENLVKSTTEIIKIGVSNSSSNFVDNSIIDITPKSDNTQSIYSLQKFINTVPFWAHQYVYSYSEINAASSEQKRFYNIFKVNFLNGEYFDLEDNTNYAFILLFDLLNEYDIHKDVLKLESQLKILGQYYPKTKSYCVSFLFKKIGNLPNIATHITEKIVDESHYSEYFNRNLGSKYRLKFNLSPKEEELFNKIGFSESKFSRISILSADIFSLFYFFYKNYELELREKRLSIEAEIYDISNTIAKQKLGFSEGKYDPRDAIFREIFNSIWKFSENVIRSNYGITVKNNPFSSYYVADSKDMLNELIFSKFENWISSYKYEFKSLDREMEIELNSIQNTRWKIKFEELTAKYKNNSQDFIESIIELGEFNKKNPSVENIFFEASKFISKFDKEAALVLYVHYIYNDLKSNAFNNKQFPKTIQKQIFQNEEQLCDFQITINQLIKDKDLENALNTISKIYKVKRKKIHFNEDSIKQVQQQHAGTVELLNEYLKDDIEGENISVKLEEINFEEINLAENQQRESSVQSIFLKELPLNRFQITILELFCKKKFSISQEEMNEIAKSEKIFTNQLIETINEICYEVLDDVLIEEEDNFYIINPMYFQKILEK